MKIEKAKDVLLKFYVKQEIDRNCQVENWGELCNALAIAVEALEKQIPQKVIYGYDDQDDILCPNCKEILGYMDAYDKRADKYCSNCGQRLDWKE